MNQSQILFEELAGHDECIRRLVRRLVLDEGAADDAIQEAVTKALEQPPDRGAVGAWLGSVARNAALLARRGDARRRTRETAVAPGEAVPSAADVVERHEQRTILSKAVLALDDPYRTVILYRFYEDQPPREIAKNLGVPVETVKSQIQRGLEQLRVRLDREFGGERRAWCVAFLPLLGLTSAKATAAAGGTAAGLTIVGALIMGTKAKIGIALVIAVVGLVGVGVVLPPLLEPQGDPELETGSPPPVERPAATAVAGDANDDPAITVAASVPDRVVKVVVVDKVTGRPIPAARLTVKEGAPSGAEDQVTGSDGAASIVCAAARDQLALSLTLPDTLGGGIIEQTLSGLNADPGERRVEVPAFSVLDLFVIEVESKLFATATIFPLPPVPDGAIPGTVTHTRLGLNRSMPERYYELLKRGGYLKKDPRIEVEVPAGTKKRIVLGIDGDAVLTAKFYVKQMEEGVVNQESVGAGYVHVTTRLKLVRGQVVSPVIHPQVRPVVSGVVLDVQGNPLGGVEVTACGQSVFRDDEGSPMPATSADRGKNGWAMRRSRAAKTRAYSVYGRRKSDDDGRFSIPMPFTDRVAVWALQPGCLKAFVEVPSVLGRYGSVSGVALRLIPSVGSERYVLLQDDLGRPIRNARVFIAHKRPRPKFEIRYPEVSTNDQGHLDTTWCEQGAEHLIWVNCADSGKLHPQRVVLADRLVVTLKDFGAK